MNKFYQVLNRRFPTFLSAKAYAERVQNEGGYELFGEHYDSAPTVFECFEEEERPSWFKKQMSYNHETGFLEVDYE